MQYVKSNNGNIVVSVRDNAYYITSEHPKYNEIYSAIINEDKEGFENYVKDEIVGQSFGDGRIQYSAGLFSWDGIPVPDILQERIMSLVRDGQEFDAITNFMINLSENPSDLSIVSLVKFLRHRNMPLTKDGCFLAYKAVKEDYKDIYSGSIDNKVGSTVSIDRSEVDDDSSRYCSTGLHVGAIDYVFDYGRINKDDTDDSKNRIIVVKVNPRDVVTSPTDNNFMKLRCCQYQVLADFDKLLEDNVYDTSVFLPPVVTEDINDDGVLTKIKSRLIRVMNIIKGIKSAK